MSRELHDFPGGLQFETWKELTDQIESIQNPLPERIILPLQQHIGIAPEPIVKIGEHVLKGQPVARENGYVSIPVHASTSGRVIDIGMYPVVRAEEYDTLCVVIEPDGKDTWFDIQPTREYTSVDPARLQALIRECGIAGLGGAGFPTHVKINEGVENAVETLIINGVECEPYITCDDRLIQEKAGYIVAGTRMIRHTVQARHCVIAVEDDMPEAYAALKEIVDEDIELVQVPARYPAGGEKQLIQVITGKEVPSGGLPIHIGIVMQNVATAAAVYRAVTRGEPLISRYVTITGNVETPRNLQVLLGTPVIDCLRACGYREKPGQHIIVGGPMMGRQVSNPNIPVMKTTNCILVEEAKTRPPEVACIRCGACVDVCPVRLMPQELYWHARAGNHDMTQRYHLFDCIECGCCSSVCPSHIPLVQYYRHAKAAIAELECDRRESEQNRNRYLAHLARQEQGDPRDREAPSTDLPLGEDVRDKQDFIRQAVLRSKSRRRQRETDE